jgi:carboxyl-terminal processing protease
MVHNNTNGDMGAFKFTTQKYYRINGGSTQLEGVKSDVVIPDRYSYIDMGENSQENPLPWDEIQSAKYSIFENLINYELIINRSQSRILNKSEIKLINENAKWIKKVRSKDLYSLKYDVYDDELKLNNEESKRFESLSDYSSNLLFESLPYELPLMEKDSVLKKNRERWHETLKQDIYIDEALNVLKDLIMNFNGYDISILEN